MKYGIALTMAAVLGLASQGQAATVSVKANVDRTMVADAGRFGGCMAKLTKLLANFNLDCPGRWVTFSCSGTFTTRDNAYRMFDQAQMAFALEKPVIVQVDDTKKHNSYCYARRIDVTR